MRITAETLASIATLVDFARAMFNKKPKASRAVELLGKNAAYLDAYMSGCERLQAAADMGVGLGTLTRDEVKAISLVDDQLVKLAGKVRSKIK